MLIHPRLRRHAPAEPDSTDADTNRATATRWARWARLNDCATRNAARIAANRARCVAWMESGRLIYDPAEVTETTEAALLAAGAVSGL